ncbi:MAG: hypothetical protein KDA65_15720, partial [Planctomycetaceae bacterium]|nr:hypothetical protein [Planctomycetaceae bacterium]
DVARDIASRHLDQMPSGSRVAIATNQDQAPILFNIDKTTARERMFALELTPSTVKLNSRIWDALSFQEQDRERIGTEQNETSGDIVDRYIREVYLFTDLSRNAWDLAEQQYLKKELERLEFVQLYLIDVSKEEPKNVTLSNIRLNREEFLENQPITMSVNVEATGQSELKRQIELYTENRAGDMIRRTVQEVELNADTPQAVELSFLPEEGASNPADKSSNWTQSIQGEIRLSSTDAMTFDNRRYFTVHRRLPPKVLIVHDVSQGGQILQDVLAPPSWRRNNKAPFRCDLVRQEALLDMDMDQLQAYDNVCLISIEHPREILWSKLERYVSNGGGLFVVVGNTRIDSVAYTTEAAMSVLPANLKGFIKFSPPESIDFESSKNHPLLKPFDIFGGFGDLPDARINWCWSVTPHPAANVISNYTFNQPRPAIVDRVLGRGHSLMLTTSIDFPTLENNWGNLSQTSWFLVLAEKIMQYTAGGNLLSRNYLAGEAVVVSLSGDDKAGNFLLRLPNLKQLPLEQDRENGLLMVQNSEAIGQYQILKKKTSTDPFFQYSLNVDDAESDLKPISLEELDNLLGAGRYQVSRSTDELTRQVGLGRIGQEMFPIVLSLLFAFFWGEHFIANRFYDHEQTPIISQ